MTASLTGDRGRVVSIFGGSRVSPAQAEYRQAREMGRLLAKSGFTICNGGYDGTMEAVALGAREVGGRTVGVTLSLFAGIQANPYLDEEINTTTLFERLEKLITLGDAFIVLPGGMGTLLEMAMVWNLAKIGPAAGKPIVLVGYRWKAALEAIRKHLSVRLEDTDVLSWAPTPRGAVELLERFVGSPQ